MLMRMPGLARRMQKLMWIPLPRYRDGFLATGHRAAGWQIPQPRVTNADGATIRLDDVLRNRWTLLHTGDVPSGWGAWQELGVPALRVSGPGSDPHANAICDAEGTLLPWLKQKGATAVVLRPDGFIYAAAESGKPLSPPPAGFSSRTVSMIGATA